ncbi:hypothetical protein [Aeromicrobium sp. 179-A 4D2 NHS]|uniref:hypothetical protein n=1 Tax=Aeromicrobium sp. 179-A 4D2 NHS TaxID=3142375 RepID=UPI00399FC8A8
MMLFVVWILGCLACFATCVWISGRAAQSTADGIDARMGVYVACLFVSIVMASFWMFTLPFVVGVAGFLFLRDEDAKTAESDVQWREFCAQHGIETDA